MKMLLDVQAESVAGDTSITTYKKYAENDDKPIQGYYIEHTYRAKNSSGNYEKMVTEFYFDKNLNGVEGEFSPSQYSIF